MPVGRRVGRRGWIGKNEYKTIKQYQLKVKRHSRTGKGRDWLRKALIKLTKLNLSNGTGYYLVGVTRHHPLGWTRQRQVIIALNDRPITPGKGDSPPPHFSPTKFFYNTYSLSLLLNFFTLTISAPLKSGFLLIIVNFFSGRRLAVRGGCHASAPGKAGKERGNSAEIKTTKFLVLCCKYVTILMNMNINKELPLPHWADKGAGEN